MEKYGYGSIPINTIFSGMNIHLPAILMCCHWRRTGCTAVIARSPEVDGRSEVPGRCVAVQQVFCPFMADVSDNVRYCELTLAYTGNLVWFYDQLWQKSSTGTSADTSEDEEEAATSWVFEAF